MEVEEGIFVFKGTGLRRDTMVVVRVEINCYMHIKERTKLREKYSIGIINHLLRF